MIKNKNDILGRNYWASAVQCFKDTKMLVFASLIIALRVAVKAARISLAAGLYLTFDCYINALGSAVYGPVAALAVGAVSDTLGCMLFPSGPYFFPFIFVEMSSGFIFALFFWKRPISIQRCVAAKFTVNFICNIVLTSVIMKWDYYFFYGLEKAEAYSIVNLARIVKSLVLFPVEALLIYAVLNLTLPRLKRIGLNTAVSPQKITFKHILFTLLLLLLSVGIVLLYIFYLKDFISAHNFKLF